MVFSLRHSNPKLFISIFESIYPVLNDVTIRISKNGMYISEMDSSHVCLVQVHIEKEDFSSFNYSSDIEHSFGISLASFVSILKVGKNSKYLDISQKKSGKLEVAISTGYDTKSFKLNLVNIDSGDVLEVPDLDYPVCIDMSNNIYSEIITGCSVVESDTINFIVKDDKLLIKSDGNLGEFTHEFRNSEFSEKKTLVIKKKSGEVKKVDHPKTNVYKIYSCHGKFNLDFSLRYFKLFSKAANISYKNSINLTAESPIRIDYEIGNNGSVVYFYLAPKISDE